MGGPWPVALVTGLRLPSPMPRRTTRRLYRGTRLTPLRSLGAVALLLFAGSIAVWAYRPWTDTRALKTPPKEESQSVSFECASPLGDNAPPNSRRTPSTSYPLVDDSPPCHLRQERRVLAVLNISLAAIALVVLIGRSLRQRSVGDLRDRVASSSGAGHRSNTRAPIDDVYS